MTEDLPVKGDRIIIGGLEWEVTKAAPSLDRISEMQMQFIRLTEAEP